MLPTIQELLRGTQGSIKKNINIKMTPLPQYNQSDVQCNQTFWVQTLNTTIILYLLKRQSEY